MVQPAEVTLAAEAEGCRTVGGLKVPRGRLMLSAPATMTALLIFCAALAPATASDLLDAIIIKGSARLTTCRSWLVYNACTTHKVQLPGRVAVGDSVELRYGSNPKHYMFHIALIRRDGKGCIILSENSGANEGGEKMELTRCIPVSEPPAEAR